MEYTNECRTAHLPYMATQSTTKANKNEASCENIGKKVALAVARTNSTIFTNTADTTSEWPTLTRIFFFFLHSSQRQTSSLCNYLIYLISIFHMVYPSHRFISFLHSSYVKYTCYNNRNLQQMNATIYCFGDNSELYVNAFNPLRIVQVNNI